MTPDAIARLLEPYTAASSTDADWPQIHAQLSVYLELILKWNARVNLTAIRTPEEIVRRHFGESLFAAAYLGSCATLLDFGSGAGFPGIPMQLLRPDIAVTLAESRTRKAAFLREVVRTLNLTTEVSAERVESMPAGRRFDTVALRAVDNMDAAVGEACRRAVRELLILSTQTAEYANLSPAFRIAENLPLPESTDGSLLIFHRR